MSELNRTARGIMAELTNQENIKDRSSSSQKKQKKLGQSMSA
jgi:hypothetical protein